MGRILIVDDSLTVRMDLAETFIGAGFEVALSENLEQARATLASESIELVILDVVLPDGHGVDLLTLIRENPDSATLPVILLSGETEVAARISGLERGADDYMGKPYDSQQVLQRVRELLGRFRLPATVLVIDDSLTFREEMRENLEAAGYQAVLAASGKEGLGLAAELVPDIIVVDGLLPESDGTAIVRQIRLDPLLQHTPCLFLTGSEFAVDEISALDAGADAYVRKTESPSVILGRLLALLRATERIRTRASLINGPRKVMLLSRGPAAREWVSPVLRAEGYDVLVTQSQDDAFKLLSLQPVDFVLLDADTLGADTRDACRRLRLVQLFHQIPIVALSAEQPSDLMIETMEAGADDWIVADPQRRDLLVARIRALLRRKEAEDLERRMRQMLSQRTLELEQANEKLAEYKEVIEQMPMGVTLMKWEDPPDPGSFRFMWANGKSAEMLQVDIESLVGERLDDCLPELLNSETPSMYATAVESGQTQRLPQLREGEDDAERIWELVAAPTASNKLAILGIDVTERELAEQERMKMETQMRAAQRMEAVGRLAGGIAHDFNNVLTVIQSYAGFLLEGLEDGDPAVSDLETIRDAADRAGRLTAQLLAFSRRQPREVAVLDLNRTVADLDNMLRRLIGEDIDLVTVLEDHLGFVRTDLSQVEQVLMNLAVNARDAMPAGGKLTVETANVFIDEEYVESKPADIPVGEYIMVSVADTGVGMDAETQARIFEPFFTTKRQGRGTGLGLSTVYGIVKQNNGYVWVYSELDRGTVFKIYFPRVEAEAATATRTKPPVSGGTEKILLVEDEEALRRAARRIMEAYGYEVIEAANGIEALRISESETFDLLLTDVVMPEMSGSELAQRLVEREVTAPVLYMSGYTDNAIVHHGVLDKGTLYLQKPFTPEALLSKIREALDDDDET